MRLLLAALLVLLATAAEAQTTITLDPADPADVRLTRRVTDRSKRIYLEVPKSTAVSIRATPPCRARVNPGAAIPWSALPPGSHVCLEDGAHAPIDPPVGTSGITVRAVNHGQASVPCIYLDNAVAIEGVKVGADVWTRTVSP